MTQQVAGLALPAFSGKAAYNLTIGRVWRSFDAEKHHVGQAILTLVTFVALLERVYNVPDVLPLELWIHLNEQLRFDLIQCQLEW